MLVRRIIPCLDIKDGRVVKGVQFLNLRDAGDPVENAIAYELQGADELVFLDITASAEKRKTVVELAEKVASNIFMPFTIGGGISSLEDMEKVLMAGADKVSINTAAVRNPSLIDEAAKYLGTANLVLAIDARRDPSTRSGWRVFIKGGREPTSKDAVEWAIEVEDRGAGEILLTSMDKDGTKDGYDVELVRAVSEKVKIPVIASGGAGRLEHFLDAIRAGADAVLAASLFHFREVTVQQVKDFLSQNGVPVRTDFALFRSYFEDITVE